MISGRKKKRSVPRGMHAVVGVGGHKHLAVARFVVRLLMASFLVRFDGSLSAVTGRILTDYRDASTA
jgi:hypothetical protein